MTGPARPRRGQLGLPLLLAALAGLAISGYLSVLRVFDAPAACGPGHGCETVASSPYAVLLGLVPVAFLGVACSAVVVGLAIRWWRAADRRALLGAYGLLLLATLFVAYLTFLELFVIEAVCPWCVGYALTVVTSLVIAGLAMRASSKAASGA